MVRPVVLCSNSMPATMAKPRTTSRTVRGELTATGSNDNNTTDQKDGGGGNNKNKSSRGESLLSSSFLEDKHKRLAVLIFILLGLTLLQTVSKYDTGDTTTTTTTRTSASTRETIPAQVVVATTVAPTMKRSKKGKVKILYPKKEEKSTTLSKSMVRRQQQAAAIITHHQNRNATTERILPPVKPPARPLKVPYPIFLASFSKSGTTSTFSAFSCYLGREYVDHRHTTDKRKGGYPELIGRCIEQNIEAQAPPFDGCGVNRNNETQTVVWTDTAYIGGPKGCYSPNIMALDAIWEAYPHATLMLVRRNATEWFRSASSKRAHFIQKWSNEACTDMPNSQTNETEWVQFYEDHTQTIRNFAAKRQGQMTYIELELESPDTGRLLQEQVGVPESCWKHCPSSFALGTNTGCKDMKENGKK